MKTRILALLALVVALSFTSNAQITSRSYLNYQGTYAAGTTYSKGDTVTYSGVTYISLSTGNVGHQPDTSSANWQSVGSSSSGSVAGATSSTAGTVTLAAGQSSNILAKVATTGQYTDLNGLPTIPAPFNGGTVTTPITAPSFISSGAGAGSFTLTAGSTPTAPTNSVVLSAPSAVTTPYVLSLPSAPPGSTALTLSCSGTTATLCNWVTASSGLGNGLSTGVNSGTYSVLSFNGAYANNTMIGMLADTSGTDSTLYLLAKTGGAVSIQSGANVLIKAIPGNHPTGSCPSGQFYFVDSAGDGQRSWCNGGTSTYQLIGSSSGLGNSLSTGVNNGTYSVLSWNGSYANGLDLGLLADTSGTDKNMYEDVPAGGKHVVRIANTNIAEWGAAGGNYYDLALNGNHTDAGRQGMVWDTSHTSKDIDWDTPSGGAQLFRVGGVGVFQVGGTTAPTAGAACTTNVYFLTQDGHLTWCNGSTWVTKF